MRSFFGWAAGGTLVLGLAACDNAATEALSPTATAQEIKVGVPAPSFDLPGSDGKTHKLAEYSGQHVVLAFFPKAFTGG